MEMRRCDNFDGFACNADLRECVKDALVVGADARLHDGGSFRVEDVHRAIVVGVVHPRIDVVEVGAVAGVARSDVPDFPYRAHAR